MMRRAQRGFTLAELMVVFCIVALLSGLLIQGVLTATRAAHRYACGNNLRQVAAAVTAYLADNGNWFPAEGNKGIRKPERSPAWFNRLPEYADGIDARHRNSIFQCSCYAWEEPEHFDHASPKSFKMNAYLDRRGRGVRAWCHKAGSWRRESSIVLFVDAVAGETGMGQWGHCFTSAVTDERHPGAVNVLYLDGHSRAVIDTPEDDEEGEPDWRNELIWTEKQALTGEFK